MGSEGFITHPLSRQSDTFAWLNTMLQCFLIYALKSKKLLHKNLLGVANVKALPNYPEECSWVI